MAITFTREYSRAQVARSENGLSDVVLSVYCNLRGVDGGYSTVAGETISLDPPDPSQFIPFDQITQELCDSWVMPKEQYARLEEVVTQMIEAQVNPPIVVKDLPFNAVPVSSDPIVEPTPDPAPTGN